MVGSRFYAEPAKIRGYSELVEQAAADVGAIGGYVQIRGSDTSGFDGLLEVLEQPVRSFADTQAQLLDDWQTRLMATEVGLWSTARRYDESDAQAQQRIDKVAGETSPMPIGGSSERFACPITPRDRLRPPTPVDNSAQFRLKDVGVLLTSVNWVIEKATGRNLLQEIIKPVSGDWGKIEMLAEVWLNASWALDGVRENLDQGLGRLASGWEGPAAWSFRQYMEKWFEGLAEESDLARAAGEKLQLVAQTSEAVFLEMSDLLSKIVDKAWQVPLASIFPIARGPLLAKLAKDTIDMIRQLDALLADLEFMLQSVQEFLDAIIAQADVSGPPAALVPDAGYGAR